MTLRNENYQVECVWEGGKKHDRIIFNLVHCHQIYLMIIFIDVEDVFIDQKSLCGEF
jgi:hypothetical protein